MTLERINPTAIYEPFNNFYTQVIRSTGTTQVHVAGMVALDKSRELVGEGDMYAQVTATMANIGLALEAAGATAADVARINIYTIDVERYLREGHSGVMSFFEGALPVSTLIGVTRLADPRYLVEIEVTAVLG